MRLASLSPLALLAGCATAPLPVAAPPPAPGMERLLGQPVDTAIALLGPATLDRREGAARQLQFGGPCILDIFYYPKQGVGTVATYAEARLPDGRSFAAGECLALLSRSTRGG